MATALLLTVPSVAPGQVRDEQAIEKLKAAGIEPIRQVHNDLAYPANHQEYVALGKQAVIMLVATSAVADELPIRSAYVTMKSVRVPLQRVALLDRVDDTQGGASQVSFYLVPISFMKSGITIYADFTGERRGFQVVTFSPPTAESHTMPAWIRLDEYDTPSDADLDAVRAMIKREYPNYVH